MNVGEESSHLTKHESNQPAASTATNRQRSGRQRHSAQSAAEPRTLIVGDSIIRNISSRTTMPCWFPQATISDVNKELRNILMKHKTANRIIIHVGKNDIRKEQSELLKKDFTELFETFQRLEVQSFISGPLPARGTNMFSRLVGLNTWLQRSCGIKGVNFINNFKIFWGHRQLFKLDGLTLKQTLCKSVKGQYLLLPPSSFSDPLCLNGTHTPRQSISDHRTSFQLQSHHVAHTSHKVTDNNMQSKRNTAHGHPSRALPTELITCRLWRITTVLRLSTQGRISGKQLGKPGQHFTATGNTRARARAMLIRHIISLSNISTSRLLTENGGTGVCWDQSLPFLRCKPSDIN